MARVYKKEKNKNELILKLNTTSYGAVVVESVDSEGIWIRNLLLIDENGVDLLPGANDANIKVDEKGRVVIKPRGK